MIFSSNLFLLFFFFVVISNEDSTLSLTRSSMNKQSTINLEKKVLPYQTIVLKQGQVRSEHSHMSVEAYENNLVRDQGITFEGYSFFFILLEFLLLFQNHLNFDIALNYVNFSKTMR